MRGRLWLVSIAIFFDRMTATSILMPLFWLAGFSNFCSNLLLPFISIVRILSSQDKSFVTHSSHDWLCRPFFLSQLFQLSWPRVFRNWCLHALHDHTTADGFKLSHPQSSQQHPSYPKEHQSTSYQPVSLVSTKADKLTDKASSLR